MSFVVIVPRPRILPIHEDRSADVVRRIAYYSIERVGGAQRGRRRGIPDVPDHERRYHRRQRRRLSGPVAPGAAAYRGSRPPPQHGSRTLARRRPRTTTPARARFAMRNPISGSIAVLVARRRRRAFPASASSTRAAGEGPPLTSTAGL